MPFDLIQFSWHAVPYFPASVLIAGVGAWIGFLVGTVLKLGVSFAMLGLFALAFIVH